MQLRLLSEASSSTVDGTKVQSITLETASANQSGSTGTGEIPKHKKPKVVKKVYMEMDDNKILAFIKQNKYALGLDDSDFSGSNNKWLAMWE